MLDGKYLATVTANRYRHDLEGGGYGDAFHGFHFPIFPQYLDGFGHVLEAFISGTRQHLKRSPLDGAKWNFAARFRAPSIDARFGPDPIRPADRAVPRLPRQKARLRISALWALARR